MKAELTLPEELTRAIVEGVTERLIPLLSGIVTREPVPEVFDKKSLAGYLKVSESTLSKLVSNKQIPHFKVAHGQSGSVRFYRRDIERWIMRQTIRDVNETRERDKERLREVRRTG